MAYKDSVFYNINSAVGLGMPNQRQDVLLVQFLLREVMNHPDSKAGRPAGNNLSLDGVFGNQTETWIRAFQNLARTKGSAIIVDGKVNSAPPDYRAKMTSGMSYTIAHLNATYRRRWRINHDYLDRCPGLPAELRQSLVERF